jgi:predicted O-linked N-acetylglucosamine transferase (SPINDLY family)
MLQRMGITETIANTPEEYIELAVHLGQNTPYREQLRERIRQRCALLFDDRTCVRALEDFYRSLVGSRG